MSCTMNPRMAVTKEVQEAASPRYGLLAAATVVESMPAHAHNGIEYVVNCEPGLSLYPTGPGQCEPGQPPNNPTKTAVPGRSITRADPFVIYGAEPCALGNQDEEQARTQLRRRLQRGERHLVEQAVDSGYAGARPYLRHPDADLIAGEALTLDDAIGALEHRLAETGRTGTIHAPRWAAPRLDDAGVMHRDGPRMRTALGNSLALGSGYSGMPPEDMEDDGMLWLYATAHVTVRRSDIIEPATWSEGAFNPVTNSGFLLAERVYVIDWPCHTWVVPTQVERPYTTAPPTASAPSLSLSHEGNTAPLQVDARVSNWGSGPVDLDWGDGSEVVTVDDGATATHTYTDPGTYTVTATSQNTGGASTTRRVRVVAPLAAPTAVQVQPSSPVAADAVWEPGDGGPAPTGFEVRWRPSGGSWSQRTRLGAQSRSWPLPQVEPDTTYEVGVRALTRQETSPETTGSGTTPAHPDPALTVEPDSGTVPLQVQLTVDNHGHGPVMVALGDGSADLNHPGDGTSTAHTYEAPGTYTVTATSQLWEQATATATVTTTEPLELAVDPVEGPLETQFAATVDNHGAGPVDLDWDDGTDPVEVEDGGTATHTYTDASTYTITATDTNNTDRTDTQQVTVNPTDTAVQR